LSNKEKHITTTEAERKEVLKAYRSLLRKKDKPFTDDQKTLIRKAFDIAVESHEGMRRKSGELYIFHPIEVAGIVKDEIGLGTTSIVCALIHDVVEDTDITLDDIELIFGKEIRDITDGLTKLSGIFDQSVNLQVENFKKLLLTLSDDVRVILIKLADRLHNMRTLGSMRPDKQRKIASETLFLYAPLAHRLGLYNLKNELEDLSLKYTEPKVYKEIETKLQKTKAVRTRFLNQFIVPIKRTLEDAGVSYRIAGRPKSVHSIYRKMQRQGIPFEEVYDNFAVRIVIDCPPEEEKALCWNVYSIVTDFYKPKPDRLRDWITTPKANGYESLHTTVMSPGGRWVEVQIRSERMDEMAEKGFASHWKYKEGGEETALDSWLERIREVIESQDTDAADFIDNFKLHLFIDEIFLFTPKGDLIKLPAGSSVLDFAFEIHTQIGAMCIGAKVNNKLVPMSHVLEHGDQVEIITDKSQKASEDWLTYVHTARAKSGIRSLLKKEKRKIVVVGKALLKKYFDQQDIIFNKANIKTLLTFYNLSTAADLYYGIKKKWVDLTKLEKLNVEKGIIKPTLLQLKNKDTTLVNTGGVEEFSLSLDEAADYEIKIADCCHPIPGDDVFGYIDQNDEIIIHRQNCPRAVDILSHKHYRTVKVDWTNKKSIAFEVDIVLEGFDRVGFVNELTMVISREYDVNMKSIQFSVKDGIFEGEIRALVHDSSHLKTLMNNIGKVHGVTKVLRKEEQR